MMIDVGSSELATLLARLCPANRIDLAGVVSLPRPLPLADRFTGWLADGRHGDLDYMQRTPEQRLDPTLRNPEARSLLIFAQRYTDGWPAGDTDPSGGGRGAPGAAWITRVARYARGLDYHDVLLRDIKAVLQGLRAVWPDLVAHPSTDTGPYLEREYAWLAGLGWLGKNTCLIHERLGSGLVLGVALTNLAIEDLAVGEPALTEPLYAAVPRRARPPAEAFLSACGSCTRCIEACPTGALAPTGGLDAGRCLSTWTIEHRGRTPVSERNLQGGLLFGCDICQAVCPWNQRAAARTPVAWPVREAYAPLPAHAELSLADLVDMDEVEFRDRFRSTPLWRCHPEGLRRNAATVRANIDEIDTEGEGS